MVRANLNKVNYIYVYYSLNLMNVCYFVAEPGVCLTVLGDNLRRARHRPLRHLPWGQRAPAGEDRRVLQRGRP